MAKFHVNPKTGKTGVCTANLRNCQFKLSEEEHYSSEPEARKAYEEKMASEVFSKKSKVSELNLNELKKLVKVSNSSKLYEEIANRGTVNTVVALLKKNDVEYKNLKTAYDRLPEARSAIVKHPNYPDSEKTVEEFFSSFSIPNSSFEFSRAETSVMNRNVAFTDEYFKYAESKNYLWAVRGMLLNPQNNISDNDRKVAHISSYDNLFRAAAFKNGVYPADKMPSLSYQELNPINVRGLKKKEYLSKLADWAVEHEGSEGYYTIRVLASNIAQNENSTDETLRKLVDNGLGYEAYYNKNASEYVKKVCADNDDRIKILDNNIKLAKKNNMTLSELRSSLIAGDAQTTIPRRNRGYGITVIPVSKEKIKEYGMTNDSVVQLMATSGGTYYNAYAKLEEDAENPNILLFRGEYDSTD